MATEIVPVSTGELLSLHHVLSTAFGGDPVEEVADAPIIEPDRFFGVRDGEQLVASAGSYAFDLTLPGAAAMPVAGVTWVGVLPTHRRRGILNQMMRHQLDDVAARGEAVAVLTASEGSIYHRYGYGVTSQVAQAVIARAKRAMHVEAAPGGSFHVSSFKEAVPLIAPVYDRWRRTQPGAISRSDGVWRIYERDREDHRFGGGAPYVVVHRDERGEVDGYSRYRFRKAEHFDEKVVVVTETIALDREVEGALWAYLLDLDLTASVEALFQPLDDPLQWRLRNPRAYDVKWVDDWLWARLLDVAVALAARTYAAEGSVVVEVDDPFRPDGAAAGRFQLDGGGDGASCKRTQAEPDVRLPVDVLGAIWLGAVPLSTYVAAGRAAGDPAAVSRVDAMFRSTPLPFCNTPF